MKSTLICLVLSLTWSALGGAALRAPPKAGGAEEVRSKVGQWDRFEAAVSNDKKYRDPCRDVTLDVVWVRPDGKKLAFGGFHDGGNTWRCRFMPDRIGTWKYEARFSDGSPGRKGSFECVASDLPGMIAVHEPNPLWFGFKGGKPVLIRSLHVGDRFFARNWDDPRDNKDGNPRAAFLDWAQKQGYNTLSVASHYLNRNAKGRGAGWDTPKLWPLDAAAYREMELPLDDLARRRILVYPFAGFFGRASAFPRDPADQTLYIKYTLARLGPYWNVLLNVAGPEPNLKNNSYLSDADIHRLGREVRKHDVFGHPLSLHNRTGDDEFKDSDWTTYGTLQGPKTVDRQQLSAGLLRNHHPKKPLYAQETLWSGNVNHVRRLGRDYSDDDLRKNAFVILMSAAALNFADNDGDSSSGFSGTLNLADRRQQRHDVIKKVWDFFETVPFHRMSPRPDLVDSGFCLAEPGREYLIYLESRGAVSVKVEGGPFRAEWINAQDTKDRRPGGTTRDGKNLTSPAAGDDWLLRLAKDNK